MSRINDGSRPSRLQLGRALAGEAALPEALAGHPGVEEFAADVAAASPPAFDAAALRARADGIGDERTSGGEVGAGGGGVVVPLFRRATPWLAGAFALAAGALFMLRLPPHANRLKGGEVELGFDVNRDGQAFPGDPDLPVRPGDRLRFDYVAGTASSVVLVGVDGTGTVQTYWPEEGVEPVAVAPGKGVLDGSILLDAAPGPEVFVASFSGVPADVVAREVATAYAEDGVDGVLALDASREDLAALVLAKD